MARSNFTKAEEAMAIGLHKMSVDFLLNATETAHKGFPLSEKKAIREDQKLIKKIINELHWLFKFDQSIYKKVGMSKKLFETLSKKTEKMSDKERKKLLSIQKKTEEFRQALPETFLPKEDDKIIEKERQKHINKRFNVSEKWLPLK